MKRAFAFLWLTLLASPAYAADVEQVADSDTAPEPAPAPPVVTPPAPALPAATPPPAAPTRARFAIELGTGGLRGIEGGALGLGAANNIVAGGMAVDFRHASLTGPDLGSSTAEIAETAISVGPWMRHTWVRAFDGRVELFGAYDAQFVWRSASFKPNSSPEREHASASGFAMRGGPGVRFWATPAIAFGYTTQVSFSTVSGPLLAVAPSASTLGLSTEEFDEVQVALAGRFTLLATF